MAYGSTIGKQTDNTKELRQCWRTPPEFFKSLNDTFNFTVDACASADNALCPRYWTAEDNCVSQSWEHERVFCNPPFGNIAPILAKSGEAEMALFLLPVTALTTRYFEACSPKAIAVPGYRVNFIPPNGLQVNTKSPSLGTVILLYGDITGTQIDSLRSMFSVYVA